MKFVLQMKSEQQSIFPLKHMNVTIFFFLRLVTLELNHYPLVQEKAVGSAEPVNGQKELNYVRGEESIEEEPCRLSFGRVICDLDLELSEEEPCRVKFRQSYL
jgi:hypothetical protein